MLEKIYKNGHILLKYREVPDSMQPLVLIHAQGADGRSYENVAKALSKKYHIYSLDCYGHGGSLHAPEQYNIRAIAEAAADFIRNVIGEKVYLLGHSSGGLIAAYIAAETELCKTLILEDPPFFSCQGRERKRSFNYIDLSGVCHEYNALDEKGDFVLYYFAHQYAWNFFPEKSREKLRQKLINSAEAYRRRHPDRDLKVPFWPKAALAGFQGMNNYDPRFGETFYDDSFHCGIAHEDILRKISCPTVFMKARTEVSPAGLLMAALSEEHLQRVESLVPQCRTVRFDCGHGIHCEKSGEFIRTLLSIGT